MPNNNSNTNNSSSSTSSTAIDNMPPPASKKRKRSAVTNEVPIRISAAPPTSVALPPPLMSYHPHLVPSYYPVYHQHPYYLQVGPQPPISPSLSPTLPTASSSNTTTTATTSTTQRILPKSPVTTPNPTTTNPPAAPLTPAFNYFPYPIQVSPQLHPTSSSPLQPQPPPPQQQQQQQQQHNGSLSPVSFHPIGAAAIRHNSISSLGSNTTADQREQARKVSHSAIERRRRERINDKIVQLKELIPACADRENLHKMTILQSAIDYIIYLKKIVEDVDKDGVRHDNKNAPRQSNDNREEERNKETEFSTKDLSSSTPTKAINNNEEEEGEDAWSAASSSPPLQSTTKTSSSSPVPTSGLKPMDLIKLNKKINTNTNSIMPPKIVIHENNSQENSPSFSSNNNNVDRHMNLENILC